MTMALMGGLVRPLVKHDHVCSGRVGAFFGGGLGPVAVLVLQPCLAADIRDRLSSVFSATVGVGTVWVYDRGGGLGMLAEIVTGVLVDVLCAPGWHVGTGLPRGRGYRDEIELARWFDTYRLTDTAREL